MDILEEASIKDSLEEASARDSLAEEHATIEVDIIAVGGNLEEEGSLTSFIIISILVIDLKI